MAEPQTKEEFLNYVINLRTQADTAGMSDAVKQLDFMFNSASKTETGFLKFAKSVEDLEKKIQRASSTIGILERSFGSMQKVVKSSMATLVAVDLSITGIIKTNIEYNNSLISAYRTMGLVGNGFADLEKRINNISKTTNMAKKDILSLISSMSGLYADKSKSFKIAESISAVSGGNAERGMQIGSILSEALQNNPMLNNMFKSGDIEGIAKNLKETAIDIRSMEKANTLMAMLQEGKSGNPAIDNLYKINETINTIKNTFYNLLLDFREPLIEIAQSIVAFFEGNKSTIRTILEFIKNNIGLIVAGLAIKKVADFSGVSGLAGSAFGGAISGAASIAGSSLMSSIIPAMTNPAVLTAIAAIAIPAIITYLYTRQSGFKNEYGQSNIDNESLITKNIKDKTPVALAMAKVRELQARASNEAMESMSGLNAINPFSKAGPSKETQLEIVQAMREVEKVRNEENNKLKEQGQLRQILIDQQRELVGATELSTQLSSMTNTLISSQIDLISLRTSLTKEDLENTSKKVSELVKLNNLEIVSKENLKKNKEAILKDIENSNQSPLEKQKAILSVQQEIYTLESEINNKKKQNANISSQILNAASSTLQKLQIETDIISTQVQLANTMGVGLRASAELRLKEVASIQKQIDFNYAQKKAQEDIMNDSTLSEEQRNQAMLNVNKIEKQNLDLKVKQLSLTKEIREGYIEAVRAMTRGSGVFSKIVMSQDQNLGIALTTVSNIPRALRTGNNRGGFTESSSYGLGSINGPAGNAIAEQSVLDDIRRTNPVSGRILQQAQSQTDLMRNAVDILTNSVAPALKNFNPTAAAGSASPYSLGEYINTKGASAQKSADQISSSFADILVDSFAKKVPEAIDKIVKAATEQAMDNLTRGN